MRTRILRKLQYKIISLEDDLHRVTSMLNINPNVGDTVSKLMLEDMLSIPSKDDTNFKQSLYDKILLSLRDIKDTLAGTDSMMDDYVNSIDESSIATNMVTLRKLDSLYKTLDDILDSKEEVTIQISNEIATYLYIEGKDTLSVRDLTTKISSIRTRLPVIKTIFNNQLIVSNFISKTLNNLTCGKTHSITDNVLTDASAFVEDVSKVPSTIEDMVTKQITDSIPDVDEDIYSSLAMSRYISSVNDTETEHFVRSSLLLDFTDLIGGDDAILVLRSNNHPYPIVANIVEDRSTLDGMLVIENKADLEELRSANNAFQIEYDKVLTDIATSIKLTFKDIKNSIYHIEDLITIMERSDIPTTLNDINVPVADITHYLKLSLTYLIDSLEILSLLDSSRNRQNKVLTTIATSLLGTEVTE